jgi:Zn-dependent peptidase ImmA (M78 family)/DNA-binding XRE family transcriptional regulator
MRELGSRLQQARKQRGLTQAEAAQLIDVARTTLTAIENGERRIKAGELIRLAHAYGRQVGDFVRRQPTVDSFAVQFRSSSQRNAQDDEQISEYIGVFQELCRDYVVLEEITQSPLVRNYPPEYKIAGLDLERAAEDIAHRERARLGLGDEPIPMLRDLLEQAVGLRIFYIEMKPAHKFSAMYAYDEQAGACIAVNRNHPEERRRMSMAHEYAHLLQNRYKADLLLMNDYMRRPESERFADSFAMHFLMPGSGLSRRYNDAWQSKGKTTVADLCTLAHYYAVSVEAMTLRLEGLRLLPTGTWDRLRDDGLRVQKARQELGLIPPPSNDSQLPQRYKYLAVRAYNEGLITEGRLALFLRVDRIQARGEIETIRDATHGVLESPHEDLSQPIGD